LKFIGQYVPRHWGPLYHDTRVPWHEMVVNRTSELKKHEATLKEYHEAT
jgi:hypothetical protein